MVESEIKKIKLYINGRKFLRIKVDFVILNYIRKLLEKIVINVKLIPPFLFFAGNENPAVMFEIFF